MKINISKLDAARRQLDSSILYFFNDYDPVSIHALTRAAHEVLEAISKKQGINSVILEGIKKFVRTDKQKMVRDKINEVKNFIKHADRDPEAVVEFDPEITQYFIWDACRLYKLLTTNYTRDMLVFTTWISIMHPDIYVQTEITDQFIKAKSVFNPSNKLKFYSDVSAGYILINQ